MKKQGGNRLPAILLCLVLVAAVLIGSIYFNFMSQRIFEDSTGHLEELYDQVSRSFGTYITRCWGLLKTWEDYIELSESQGLTDAVPDYLAQEQTTWGFTSVYFISREEIVRPNHSVVGFALDDQSWETLERGEPVMVGETLPSGLEVTLFAIPTPGQHWGDIHYDALGVAYINTDMASSLNMDAFQGEALTLVVHGDGSVLLSTQAGGTVFRNYLTYLQRAANLEDSVVAGIRADWANGRSGLLQCEIGGVSHVILYQSVGYQDYILLSAVPEDVISAGFQTVQRTTIFVLIGIFGLVGAAVVWTLVDNSRRRHQEDQAEMQYREEMFGILSNNVDDFFIMLNAETLQVDYISPNVERLLGLQVEEIQKDIRVLERCAVNCTVVIPKDALDAIPLGENRHWECEYMHQGTGEQRSYRMNIYRMDVRGLMKYIVVMSDRTLEKQMNQKLQDALMTARSANEAKSNFLSNMSHDIRTPMNAIVGFSVLLEKDADRPDKVREYTRKITASSQHLLSLINDVLDMSKIESNKTSLNVDIFSLPELLEELSIILQPQAKAKQQDFEIHVSGNPPEQLTGDKLRLNQILLNLLSNAIKYTPAGGSILFRITELPNAAPHYAGLRFTVQDNGIGMSEEFQKTVFDPFSREVNSATSKIQGTGLGMAITKNLVDLMGGVISLESQLGKGSTFTVDLTFALPQHIAPSSTLWVQQKVSRVLVSDSDSETCQGIQTMLQSSSADLSVSAVSTTAALLSAVQEARSSGQDFQVILLDKKLTGTPDLLEAVRQIRAQPEVPQPLILLAAYDWTDIEDDARSAGVNAFLPKPFFVSSFWHVLEPLYRSQAPADQVSDAGAHADAAQEGVLEGRYFLVAEDNDLNAEILTEMLDIEGARCRLAPNGKEAYEIFCADPPGTYDMILMDVQMPVMNGYDATRAIRASSHPEAKTIPIVAMTANTFAEDVRNAMDAGMDAHVAKPIDMKAVRETVGRLLKPKDSPASSSGSGSNSNSVPNPNPNPNPPSPTA